MSIIFFTFFEKIFGGIFFHFVANNCIIVLYFFYGDSMELSMIKGLGEKTVKLLNQCGIYRAEDLLTYYPYRYEVFNPTDVLTLSGEFIQTVNVLVESEPVVSYIRRNFNTLRFRVSALNKVFQVSIFNRAFMKPHIEVGKKITIIGRYDEKKNTFLASDIKLKAITSLQIKPVYHLVRGLKNANFEKWLQEVMKLPMDLDVKIPFEIEKRYHFISQTEAFGAIHFPKCAEDVKRAKVRFIYEELFEFMFKIMYLKEKETKAIGLPHVISDEKVNDFVLSLPFELTKDQKQALADGLQDLKSEKRMNRLLLGDVGSGKTIVAFILMYANVLSGYQSVLMAPTEILATQHYQSCKKFFDQYPVRIELLVGSMKASEKKKVFSDLSNQEVDIVIGTHALLNDQVVFANLGLVVTDEQHRFGVNQRKNLQNKGYRSDVLYLSATPIPRTYALTIYGDMDTSMIATKPQGRKPVRTLIKKEADVKEILQAIYHEFQLGHQIYVVAPMIEESEMDDLKDVHFLKEKFELAFRDKVNVGVLHGKMKASEKDQVMKSFEKGEIQILISTTVIEVGVDVPNATMIVIFNAERFGLATLHQLRGRVGRNNLQSTCILISNQEVERLKVLEESNDGFYISEKDFELRGQGDLFGVEQSGDMSFKMADLKRDYKILLQAKNDVIDYLKSGDYFQSAYYRDLTNKIDFTN